MTQRCLTCRHVACPRGHESTKSTRGMMVMAMRPQSKCCCFVANSSWGTPILPMDFT
ncbi:hypothetical protein V8C34DRAFT_273444 [Trichoderma compactum]